MSASDPNGDLRRSWLDGLLELVDLPVAGGRRRALEAAVDSAAEEHALLRAAARGWDPDMVFDPRWD